jgi:LPXTG-motif cell wall-anchored protein
MATKSAIAIEEVGIPWWVVLVEGIFALIFGIFLITAPGSTSVFLVTVLGFYWLIRGIFAIIEIFIPNTGTHWGWLLFMGILGIIAGLVVLRHPIYATAIVGTFLIVFLAVDGLIMGILGLIRAFTGAGWGPGILGILTIIIAIFLLINVYSAVSALPIVIGAFLIVGGIVAIFYAFRIRRVERSLPG